MKDTTVFITASPDKHVWTGKLVKETDTVELEEAISFLYSFTDYISIDIETNGLDAHENEILLVGLYNPTQNFSVIFDATTVNIFNHLPDDWDEYNYIGHNIKFDLGFMLAKYDKAPHKVIDTMIANQKIFQNLSEMRHGLDAVVAHWKVASSLDKKIRAEFISVPAWNYHATDAHIEYLVDDIRYLRIIWNKQVAYMPKTLHQWCLGVEFPLTRVIAKMENRGVSFDIPALVKIIDDLNTQAFAAAKRADELVQLIGKDNLYVKGGKLTARRNEQQLPIYTDLFGNQMPKGYMPAPKSKKPVKIKTGNNNVNWASADQIIEVFGRLGLAAPVKDGGYAIPIIQDNGKAAKTVALADDTGVKIKIPGWSTDNKTFHKYLIDKRPDPLVVELIECIETHNKATHLVNSFGENYIEKLNEMTGRIHSVYRQATTANGRLSSGGGDKQPKRINNQNIPRDKRFRQLFVATEGYEVITADLSGAEVTIICDKAKDEKLYEMAVKQDDAHSPIVQNSWRNMFLYRAAKAAGVVVDTKDFFKRLKYRRRMTIAEIKRSDDLYVQTNLRLAETFTVTKTINKPYRQSGKNCTFGSLYNMGAMKAMETYNGTDAELAKAGIHERVNVTREEAAVALWAIRQAIPKSFEYMDLMAEMAFKQGFLVLNERSSSKVWFEPVLQVLRTIQKEGDSLLSIDVRNAIYETVSGEVYTLPWQDAVDISGQARNLTISGTQADMLKEVMVVVDRVIEAKGLDVHLLMQIHDELVYEARIGLLIDGIPFKEWLEDTMKRIVKLFLNHFQMGVDVQVGPSWTK